MKGQYPTGGLKTLQDTVSNDLPLVEQIIAIGSYATNKMAYRSFMQILFSAVYVFSVQGRLSGKDDFKNNNSYLLIGVHDLKYGQRFQLLEEGFAMSSQFKTQTKYGFQAITLGKIAKDLFTKYINFVRPDTLQGENDPLWLGSTGILNIVDIPHRS